MWLCQWSRPDIYSTVKLPSLAIHQTAGFNTRYAANLNKPMYHDSVKGTKVELLNMMVLEIIDRTKITFSSIHISDYKQV